MRRFRLDALLAFAAALLLSAPALQAQEAAPGTGVWRNYDFVRGDSNWVATDWSDERVGRFPTSQLSFVSGNMEIVERDGVKLLEAKSASVVRVALPDSLPEQFTVEFNLEIGAGHFASTFFTAAYEGRPAVALSDYLYLYWTPGIYRKSKELSATPDKSFINALQPFKLQVDGSYATLYLGSTRVSMVPTANFIRGDSLEFRMNGQPGRESYLSEIVVAVGLDPLYE